MARLTPEFSTNRMMEDYLVGYYLPGAVAYRDRVGRDAAKLLAWRGALDAHWNELSFEDYSVETTDGPEGQMRVFHVNVSAGRVAPTGSGSKYTPNPTRYTCSSKVAATPMESSVTRLRCRHTDPRATTLPG